MKRISKQKEIKESEFNHVFEKGDVTKYLDLKTAKAHYPVQRINIDFTIDILAKVDTEASRIGVPRTSPLKLWIAERVDRLEQTVPKR